MDHLEVQVGDAASLAPAGGNAAPERRDLAPAPAAATPSPGRWARFLDGDFWHSFRSSPTAIGAAIVALLCIVAAVFANVIAPHRRGIAAGRGERRCVAYLDFNVIHLKYM